MFPSTSSAESPVPPRALFVVGMPRSGTTLLTRLLDGHHRLLVLPHETHATHLPGAADPVARFFEETLYRRSYPAGSAERQRFEQRMRAGLGDEPGLKSILLAIVAAVQELQAPGGRADAWVEKTPRHVRSVPALIAGFGPATRCIGMVRDPRAVLASRRERFDRTSSHHVRHFARRWATVDALTHRYLAHFPREFMAVTYEALVRDPEPVMRRVAAHAGIEWSDSLLRPTADGSEWSANSSFRSAGDAAAGAATSARGHGARGAQGAAGISTASVERWREELSAAEVAQAEQLLGPRMRHWGYATTGAAGSGPSWQRALVEAATRLHVWSHRREWRRAID
jgi:hypothetical protein